MENYSNNNKLDTSFDIRSFLSENGYDYKENNNYLQIAAKWREGQDQTSVCIYPESQVAIDFVTGEKMGYKGLVGKILNLDNGNLEEYIKGKKYTFVEPNIPIKPKIEQLRIFDNNLLNNILPIYEYPKSRGISEDTCKLLKCGVVGKVKGKLSNRFSGPVFNSKNQIIGWWGRDLTGKSKSKYLLLGAKKFFVYPAFININDIKSKKEVILVESPFDTLTLFECGIKNVLCLFGIEMSLAVLNFLLRINPNKIIISVNNDNNTGKHSVGNDAAVKIEKKLRKYFDSRQVIIKLPSLCKDWNETLVKYGVDQLRKELYG